MSTLSTPDVSWAVRLAATIAVVPQASLVGVMHGQLHTFHLSCNKPPPPPPHSNRAEQSGALLVSTLTHSLYNASDAAAPLGDALRRRALHICADDRPAEPFAQCALESHMYSDDEWRGIDTLAVDAACVHARNAQVYGPGFGVPLEPAADSALPPLPRSPPPSPSSRPPPGHLEPLGAQGQPRRPIRVIAGCGSHDVFSQLILLGEPVIFRGCLHERSPASRHWSAEHVLRIAPNQSNQFCQMTHAEYMAQPTIYARSCGGPPRPLMEELAVPPVLDNARMEMLFDKVNMWFSRRRYLSSSPLHWDPNENLMHQVRLSKHLVLIDPVDSALLYSDYADMGKTPVDPLRVDLARYPLAARATLHTGESRAGDVTYIPSGWWHHVTTQFGDDPEEQNMMLTLQFDLNLAHADPTVSRGGFSAGRAESSLERRRLSASDKVKGFASTGRFANMAEAYDARASSPFYAGPLHGMYDEPGGVAAA